MTKEITATTPGKLVTANRLTIEESNSVIKKLHGLEPGNDKEFLGKLLDIIEENQYNDLPAGKRWYVFNYIARLLLVSSKLIKEELKALPAKERKGIRARLKAAVPSVTNNTRFGYDLAEGRDPLTVLMNNSLFNCYLLDKDKKADADSQLNPNGMLTNILNLFVLNNHPVAVVDKELSVAIHLGADCALAQYLKNNPNIDVPSHPTVLWMSQHGVLDGKLMDAITDVAIAYFKEISV